MRRTRWLLFFAANALLAAGYWFAPPSLTGGPPALLAFALLVLAGLAVGVVSLRQVGWL